MVFLKTKTLHPVCVTEIRIDLKVDGGYPDIHAGKTLIESWENLRGADAHHLLRRNALGVRACAVRHGSVLLSERSESLSRHRILQDLERRFCGCDVGSKSCQFSQAYVITHEVGHHVQNLLGVLPQVQQAQRGMDTVESNQLQVRVEAQQQPRQ